MKVWVVFYNVKLDAEAYVAGVCSSRERARDLAARLNTVTEDLEQAWCVDYVVDEENENDLNAETYHSVVGRDVI